MINAAHVGLARVRLSGVGIMSDILDKIAEEVGTVTDEQENSDEENPSREGEEFDPSEFYRDKEDYDGGW